MCVCATCTMFIFVYVDFKMGKKGQDGKPSDDFGWKFATPISNNRSKMTCNFCGRVVTSGITRLKQHLARIEGDITPCPKVPRAVREDMKKLIFEWQAKQKQKKILKSNLRKKLSKCMRVDNIMTVMIKRRKI